MIRDQPKEFQFLILKRVSRPNELLKLVPSGAVTLSHRKRCQK